MQLDKAKQEFCGQVVLSLNDAARIMNSDPNYMDTWVVRPWIKGGSWEYVYTDEKFETADRLPWKKCKPMTLEKVNHLLYKTAAADRGYSTLHNNCQHFAEELFDMIKAIE